MSRTNCDATAVQACVNQGKYCNIDTGKCVAPATVKDYARDAKRIGEQIVVQTGHGVVSKRSDIATVQDHIRRFGLKQLEQAEKGALQLNMTRKTIDDYGSAIVGEAPTLTVAVPPQLRTASVPATVATPSVTLATGVGVDVEPVVTQPSVESILGRIQSRPPPLQAAAPAVALAPGVRKLVAKPCDQAKCVAIGKICGVKGDCIANTPAARARMALYESSSIQDLVAGQVQAVVEQNLPAIAVNVANQGAVQLLEKSLEQAKAALCASDADCAANELCNNQGKCVENNITNRILNKRTAVKKTSAEAERLRLAMEAQARQMAELEEQARRLEELELADEFGEAAMAPTQAPTASLIDILTPSTTTTTTTMPTMPSMIPEPIITVPATAAPTPAQIVQTALTEARIAAQAEAAGRTAADAADAARIQRMVVERALKEEAEAREAAERARVLNLERQGEYKSTTAPKEIAYEEEYTQKGAVKEALKRAIPLDATGEAINPAQRELKRTLQAEYEKMNLKQLADLLRTDDSQKREVIEIVDPTERAAVEVEYNTLAPSRRTLVSTAVKLGNKWRDVKGLDERALQALIVSSVPRTTFPTPKETAAIKKTEYATRRFAGDVAGEAAADCITEKCILPEVCNAESRQCAPVKKVVYESDDDGTFVHILKHDGAVYYGSEAVLRSIASELGANPGLITRVSKVGLERLVLNPETAVSSSTTEYLQTQKQARDAEAARLLELQAASARKLQTLRETGMTPRGRAVKFDDSNPAAMAAQLNKVSTDKPLSEPARRVAEKIKQCLGLGI